MGFDSGRGILNIRSLDGVRVVSAPAEIDCATIGQLCGTLLVAAVGVTVVVADMTATTFCDGTSLGRLVQTKAWLEESLVELRLAGCSARVRKVMAITGDDHVLPVFGSLAEAVAMKPCSCRHCQAA
jgi:anti-anti-sigma factor